MAARGLSARGALSSVRQRNPKERAAMPSRPRRSECQTVAMATFVPDSTGDTPVPPYAVNPFQTREPRDSLGFPTSADTPNYHAA